MDYHLMKYRMYPSCRSVVGAGSSNEGTVSTGGGRRGVRPTQRIACPACASLFHGRNSLSHPSSDTRILSTTPREEVIFIELDTY